MKKKKPVDGFTGLHVAPINNRWFKIDMFGSIRLKSEPHDKEGEAIRKVFEHCREHGFTILVFNDGVPCIVRNFFGSTGDGDGWGTYPTRRDFLSFNDVVVAETPYKFFGKVLKFDLITELDKAIETFSSYKKFVDCMREL